MRHAQQVQRTGLADPHQLGEELRRVVDVLDDFGGYHPGGRGVGNRQRVAVGHVALDFARGVSLKRWRVASTLAASMSAMMIFAPRIAQ